MKFALLVVFFFSVGPVTKGQLSKLDREVSDRTNDFWFSKIKWCGMAQYFTKDRNYVHHFKIVSIEAGSSPLSPADRLNGIEYRGHTKLTVGQSRTFSPRRTQYQDAGWTRWYDGFTPALGGIGLDAKIEKRDGRWIFTPNPLSQVDQLRQISCVDAANPAAAARRATTARVTAAVEDFKRRAPEMAIYTNNLTADMWEALYRVGNADDGQYATVSSVYLGGNGGFAFCGRRGCAVGGVTAVPNGYWIEQLTPDGGYVLLGRGDDNNGHPRRDYMAERINADVLQTLNQYHAQGLYIKKVRIGYKGEWFVLASGENRCIGCPVGDVWSWHNFPPKADNGMRSLAAAHRRNPDSAERIQDVAFTPEGGFVMIYGNYKKFFTEGNVPEDAVRILQMLTANGKEINQITFGPNGSWIIRANGWW